MAQDPDQVMLHDPEVSATASPSATPATERLRSEIEETRSEISETIDAIQSRLRPGELINRATRAVTQTTVEGARNIAAKAGQQATGLRKTSSRTAAGILQRAKDHPVPASMVGLAATGLLFRVLRPRRRSAGFLPGHVHGPRRTRGRARMATAILKNVPFFAVASILSWAARRSRIAREASCLSRASRSAR
jgi:hypothetical protein